MLKKFNIISLLTVSLLVVSCGYKRIADNKPSIHFQEIVVNGENKISYLLKNNINLISDKNSKNKYDLVISLTKNKEGKIKNDQGKVVRYVLSIEAKLNLKDNNNNKSIKKTFSKKNDFDVTTTHSETINNERVATKIIIQQLTDEIINFITFSYKN